MVNIGRSTIHGWYGFRNGRKDPNPLVACKEPPVAVTQNPRMSEIQLWQVASAEQVPKGCRVLNYGVTITNKYDH